MQVLIYCCVPETLFQNFHVLPWGSQDRRGSTGSQDTVPVSLPGSSFRCWSGCLHHRTRPSGSSIRPPRTAHWWTLVRWWIALPKRWTRRWIVAADSTADFVNSDRCWPLGSRWLLELLLQQPQLQPVPLERPIEWAATKPVKKCTTIDLMDWTPNSQWATGEPNRTGSNFQSLDSRCCSLTGTFSEPTALDGDLLDFGRALDTDQVVPPVERLLTAFITRKAISSKHENCVQFPERKWLLKMRRLTCPISKFVHTKVGQL